MFHFPSPPVKIQDPSFNRGYWSDFEEWIRLLVVPKEGNNSSTAASSNGSSNNPVGLPFKDVYVITGPLFLPSREVSSYGEFRLFALSLNFCYY